MSEVISAFSIDQVTKITGASIRQLRSWDARGFFRPSFEVPSSMQRVVRLYSFEDVVGLRVISVLKNTYKLSLRRLEEAAMKLLAYSDKPWSKLKVCASKREVVLIDENTGRGEAVNSGQFVMVPIIDHIRHVRNAAASLSKRSVSQIGKYTRKKNITHNREVFSGTRIPLRAVENFVRAGYSDAEILREYPSLQARDIELVRSQMITRNAA